MNSAQDVLHKAEAEEGAGQRGYRRKLSREGDRVFPARRTKVNKLRSSGKVNAIWTLVVLRARLSPTAALICHLWDKGCESWVGMG